MEGDAKRRGDGKIRKAESMVREEEGSAKEVEKGGGENGKHEPVHTSAALLRGRHKARGHVLSGGLDDRDTVEE